MDNQPAFDRSILIPISIGAFSIVGILVVLLVGRSLNSPAQVPPTPSATRFQFVFLGTEPAITTPLVEESGIAPTEQPAEEPLPEPLEPTEAFTTPTVRPGVSPPVILSPSFGSPTPNAQRTNTPVLTSTSVSGAPLNPGTYDDIDSHLVYSSSWSSTEDDGAYEGTLHVSLVPNAASTVSFRFIGNGLRLFYQGGQTLGRLTVAIDNVSETLDQSDGNDEWVWPNSLANGTHSVVITHSGGGSVNLDYVIVPEVPLTATPTRTLTPTP